MLVEISGFRNDQGKAKVCLFNNEKGFPLRPEDAYQVVLADISGQRSRAEFKKMPRGAYAVGVLHDENSNGRMDTNTLGMPMEGVGTSNNPKSFFGPPGFEDARLTVDGADMTVRVIIRYP
ncbi:MAG: DUF2141 domain-containing protein [Nitrospirota bacterium]|nr:DUF2141 domain-containing protein [Nitrospirota bacterium]